MISNLLMSKKSGFTLVELLVVIAIIAILSVVGVVVFRGVTTSARDAQRKADLEAISKAYEIKYSSAGSYQALANTDFAGGAIPKTPEGNNYPCLIGPESNCTISATDKVAYCVSLGDNQSTPCYSSSNTCYCSSSTQGSSLSGGGSGGGGSNPSCDPYGVLTSGLVGYWKMDEITSPNLDSSGNSITAAWQNDATSGAGKYGNGLVLDGNGDYALLSSEINLYSTPITLAAWIKPTASLASGNYPIFGEYCNRFTFGFWNGPLVLHYYDNTNTESSYVSYSGTFNQNTWYHVVATLNGTDGGRIYVNGVEAARNASAKTASSSYGFISNIGADTCYSNRFQGVIDEARIYNRALSPNEVSALYSGGNGCIP